MITHDQIDIRRSTVMDRDLIQTMAKACNVLAFRLRGNSGEALDDYFTPAERHAWKSLADIGGILSRCACNIAAMTAEDRDNIVYIVDAIDTSLWTDDAVKALRRLDNSHGWHSRHMPYTVEKKEDYI